MRHFFFYCTILLFGIAANAQPVVNNEPAWISRVSFPAPPSWMEKQAEDGYLDMVFEKQVNIPLQTVFYRRAQKILNETGIENSSQVSVDYDPSYQKVFFHSLTITREGKTINKLQAVRFKIIQQETELARKIYNGTNTKLAILEDVRKGDVISYSYSLKGFNPIFGGRYANGFQMGFSVPVAGVFFKVIAPAGMPFNVKQQATDIKPFISKTATEIIYEWKAEHLHPISTQDMLPSWYNAYPSVSVSQLNSWKEVNNWAMTLFPVRNTLSPALQQKVNEIRKQFPSKEKQLAAVLRFVQDDVRYMGIEVGESSHRPNDPVKIFAQRFGDCKDKAYLLCTMLNALGIEAHPVLINTDLKAGLYDVLPSFTAFDHTTVMVLLNSKKYFFDATINYQRGNIDAISFPDYQAGLVLTDTTTSITKIPLQEKGVVKTREAFNIPDASGKAGLIVYTEYTGSFADNMRRELSSNSIIKMQEAFTRFYNNYYKTLRASDSLVINDEEETGTLKMTEYYEIEDLWEVKDGKRNAWFSPSLIFSVLKKPQQTDRKMPISLIYPAKYIEDIELNMYEPWPADDFEVRAHCDAFNGLLQGANYGSQIKLHYEYEALKDHVLPEEAKDFFKGYDKFENGSYHISINGIGTHGGGNGNENKTAAGNDHFALQFVITLLIGGIIAFFIWRSQRNKTWPPARKSNRE